MGHGPRQSPQASKLRGRRRAKESQVGGRGRAIGVHVVEGNDEKVDPLLDGPRKGWVVVAEGVELLVADLPKGRGSKSRDLPSALEVGLAPKLVRCRAAFPKRVGSCRSMASKSLGISATGRAFSNMELTFAHSPRTVSALSTPARPS